MDQIQVSAGAILLFAALYFFDTTGILSAVLPAVIVHELGHFLALRMLGARITQFRLDMAGFCMEYTGVLHRRGEFFAAFAGPLLGGIYTLLLSWIGKYFYSEYLLCTAGVSLVLSAYNLLPAMPLDGGKCLYAALSGLFAMESVDVILSVVSVLVAMLMIAFGAYMAVRGKGAALLIAGGWIFFHCLKDACQNSRLRIK